MPRIPLTHHNQCYALQSLKTSTVIVFGIFIAALPLHHAFLTHQQRPLYKSTSFFQSTDDLVSTQAIPSIVFSSSTASKSTRILAASNNNNDNDAPATSLTPLKNEYDVIVVGAGIGGLSCAALCAKYGLHTLLLEAHDTPGGCAHSFTRYSSSASKKVPFCFDSGPSLLSGLSSKGTNPLRQVLDALDLADNIDWVKYDGWMVHDTSDGSSFRVKTGSDNTFANNIEIKAGSAARKEFEDFNAKLLASGGLAEASAFIPPFALRGDLGAIASLARYAFKLLQIGPKGNLLTGPFSKILDMYNCNDPFVRQWYDYLAFALSGLDAAHTQAAAVAYMAMDLHKPNAVLDYPKGGMDALIQTLVKGLELNGGTLRLNSRVEQFILDDKDENNKKLNKPRCSGVVLDDGTIVRARNSVVCNAPLWNMARILNDSLERHTNTDQSSNIYKAVKEVQQNADDMCMSGSFMHLHLGVPSDGLPDDLECHHSVLDWSKDVTAEQNMVIISIPTVFDPNLAPLGYHVIHAYTAACDSFVTWLEFLPDGTETGKVGVNPNTGAASKYGRNEKYQNLKDDKAGVLWKAIECVIPDIRKRAQSKGSIVMVGTPLTHRRYNQRFRGTYGPAPSFGESVWKLGGATTPIANLLACGDTTFPGIGLPGVAASGTIAANTCVSVNQQTTLLKKLKQEGALQ